ncbi:ABC transporter substrate-binding protein [Cupriavidus sp. 30B13]|uniref:ABC transporter substrate-binding protein n=1 Tax=Cupriavidus sp. 30B13 TaxID=3384241 RepID=UPI003B8F6BD4
MSAGTLQCARRRAWLRAAAATAALPAFPPAVLPAARAAAHAAPPRVVVLSWELAEMLLSLGVTPAGLPAPAWYASSIVAPPLPAGVVDVGLLFQPNFDLLYELRPDLLLVTPAHASARPLYERIAPTLTLGGYMSAPDPVAAMRGELATLAARLGAEDRARTLLAQTGRAVARARQALDAGAPAGGYPAVYVAQAVDERHVRLFGAHSMFDDVLAALGLRNAFAGARRAVVALDRLAAAPAAAILWVGPGARQLRRNPLWRLLPFAQAGRTATLPVIAEGGALVSVQRFARAVADVMRDVHAG